MCLFKNLNTIGFYKNGFLTIVLFFVTVVTIFAQDHVMPDTVTFKQNGLKNDGLHYLYKDTIKSTTTNYTWPLFEINIVAGYELNNWIYANPENDFSLDVIEFKDEYDGIKRNSEMGNYEVELKLNTAKIEFFALYNSHFIPYQLSLDNDQSTFANYHKFESRNRPFNRNEVRTGINIIIKKHIKNTSKTFYALKNSGLNCEIYTDYSHSKNDTLFYNSTEFVDIIYNYPAVENIITQTFTAFNIGYVRTSFPIVYNQEEVFTYFPEFEYSLLTSYLMHWDKYAIHGISLGIMQRTFSRYKVEFNSPINEKFGLGEYAKDYRCPSMEYGLNILLGTPIKSNNESPFDFAKTGGELYFKTSWEPYFLKFSGGKMLGRPNDWFIRTSLGFTIRGGNKHIDTKERKYLVSDYL